MDFLTISGEDVRAVQILTGTTFVVFLIVGIVPALRPYAARIRLAIVAIYFVLAATFMIYLLAR